MRHRTQNRLPLRRLPQGAAVRHDSAVAVLHAVAIRPGQVVGQEGVGAAVELRQLAEDAHLLAHDLLDVAGVLVGLNISAVVMQRDANRLRAMHPIVDGEGAPDKAAELDGTVHQVVQVRGRERQGIVGGKQLRGHLPGAPRGTLEPHARRAHERPAHEHEGRRCIDVRVARIDAEVRAVRAIAKHLVAHDHCAVVAGDIPLVQAGTARRQQAALAIGHLHVEHVLRELVERIAAGRHAAHPDFGRPCGQAGEAGLDLHPALLDGGKLHAVLEGRGHRRLRPCSGRHKREPRTQQAQRCLSAEGGSEMPDHVGSSVDGATASSSTSRMRSASSSGVKGLRMK